MADKAIVHTMKLTVKEGVYFLTMNFQGLTVGDKLGYLGTLDTIRRDIPQMPEGIYREHFLMSLLIPCRKTAMAAR